MTAHRAAARPARFAVWAATDVTTCLATGVTTCLATCVATCLATCVATCLVACSGDGAATCLVACSGDGAAPRPQDGQGVDAGKAEVVDAVASDAVEDATTTPPVDGDSTGSDVGLADGGGDLAAWRSTIYPIDWQPGWADSDGRRLHDFSFAGYRGGGVELGQGVTTTVFEAISFGADPTAAKDSTAALQAALDAAVSAGAGVVHIAAGLYRVDGTLHADGSHLVVRGDGPAATRLWFTSYAGLSHGAHLSLGGALGSDLELPLASDAAAFETTVEVADAGGLAVGDDVALGWTITPDFVADHGMTGTWKAFNGTWQPFFRRAVVAIDATQTPHQLVLDVPLRYRALIRDGASLRRETGWRREVGVESIGVSNAVGWQEAWSENQVHAIELRGVADGWLRDVASFASPGSPADGPGAGDHLQSGGVRIHGCKRVTVADSQLERAQNRGGGGNGYLFEIRQSAEVLMRDCVGRNGRHNFIQNWGFGTTGWVLLRVKSSGGGACLSPMLDLCPLGYSEFHHSLAMANLVDSSVFDDGVQAQNRGDWSTGAGHTATESVFWNTRGSGWLRSMQFAHGYVIGTGADIQVRTEIDQPSGAGTAPEDWREGLGEAATLEPQSLYGDQLQRRIGAVAPTP